MSEKIIYFLAAKPVATGVSAKEVSGNSSFDESVQNTETLAETGTEEKGVLGALGLNGQLFVAQLVNFGIVLFILWKWVFTPVAKKLTERTERIEKAMRDAASTETERAEFETWKVNQMSKARKEASEIITAAHVEAKQLQEDIVSQTKLEQVKLVEQAKKQIDDEKNKSLSQAKSELADLVTVAAEKILRQKLDPKKDQELIKESLKNIK